MVRLNLDASVRTVRDVCIYAQRDMTIPPVDIPIRLLDETVLSGTNPVVVLGPNGAGKSRFATDLASRNGAEIVSALRNIQLQPELPAFSPTQALNNLTSQLNNRKAQPWQMSNEIDSLFAKLIGDDASSAIRFRDEVR